MRTIPRLHQTSAAKLKCRPTGSGLTTVYRRAQFLTKWYLQMVGMPFLINLGLEMACHVVSDSLGCDRFNRCYIDIDIICMK